MKRTAASALVLLASWWPAGAARANWSATASGSATARSTTLAATGTLAVSCGTLPATVKLDWGASATPWIGGYEVRWGALTGVYTSSATTAAVTYTTPALPTGPYFFAVRATKGQWRSANSNEVTKVIVSVAGVATCQ